MESIMRNSLIQTALTGITLLSSLVMANAQQTTPDAAAPINTPLAAAAPTPVPALVPFSSAAISSKGKPLAGETTATFLIYKDQQGGEPLFSESQSINFDETGHYKVQLGASNPNGLPADLFSTGEARWLEVQIAGQQAEPRVLLASVPYALKAADAATLGGLPASAFALAGSAAVVANATPAAFAPDATAKTVTTTGGAANKLAKFTGASTIGNSIVYDNGTQVGIGTTTPTSTLTVDGTLTVNGNSTYDGQLVLPATGTATAKNGFASQFVKLQTSAYNSSSKTVVPPRFQLQAEVTGNNTASPNATLNLLASANSSAPVETGFSINTKGVVHFASGQTFPGTGSGTISGITAGTGLTGGGTSGKVTLNVDTGKIPTLGGNNSFTGSNVFVPSIYEDTDVNIDNTNANSGGISPGLRFGSGSGEGMASQRTSDGDNQYGLNFYTGYTRQMAISAAGNVGIGGIGSTGVTLSSYAGSNVNAGFFQSSQNAPTLYVENDSISTQPTIYSAGSNGFCYIENNGSIDCSGTISGSAKNFKIDNPADPANKYLVHTSIESSEMVNIYSGNVTTDELGLATVKLPDWFEAENTDFRYQLTVVGQFAQAIIKDKVANGQFRIMTNASRVEVSWQITGVRQDAYAKAHPLVAEQTKAANERGFYRDPEAFGLPREKGIAWSRRAERPHPTQQLHKNISKSSAP